jgi:hypothetical protein
MLAAVGGDGLATEAKSGCPSTVSAAWNVPMEAAFAETPTATAKTTIHFLTQRGT